MRPEKTALLAQRMDDKGSLLAWDKYPHRVRLAHYTAKRLGATIVHTDAQDATMPKPELYAAMDAVLVDAPCSGLGVIGSKPDIVLNKTEKDFAALAQLQGSILDACCRYVRPGGKLVYSTCTISPIENQQVVQAFLQSHGEFKLADNDFLPASLSLRKGESGPGVQLFPHLTGMDGFYIAKMERAL